VIATIDSGDTIPETAEEIVPMPVEIVEAGAEG
jgi:hypothetical protein